MWSMAKLSYFIIGSTILIGYIAGIFLYFQTRDPDNTAPTLEEERTADAGFEIIGYSYGGCERIGCASYRVLDDGSYSYLAIDRAEGDERFEDALSTKRIEELQALVDDVDLETVLSSSFVGTCPVTYDGLAYRYEMRMEGVWYSIDSCKQDIEREPLFGLLGNYFEIFRALHAPVE